MDKDGNILKAKTQTASEATSPVSEPQVSKEAVSAHVPTESDGEFELVEVPNWVIKTSVAGHVYYIIQVQAIVEQQHAWARQAKKY